MNAYIEKIKGRGYNFPFKLSIVFNNVSYTSLSILLLKLQIEEIEYRKAVKEFNGNIFGTNRFTFFKSETGAYRFINEFLIPRGVALKLMGGKKR